MKEYRIVMATEYIIEADTIDNALDMINENYASDSWLINVEAEYTIDANTEEEAKED